MADKYRLVRQIGAGGMGTVYEAVDTVLDRKVAVKLLHTAPMRQDSEESRRFLREGQAMARISHPCVAVVFDMGIFEDAPYIVMELLDGLDLDTLVRRSGRLDPELARALAVRMCAGLEAAHRVGVLHRDVKPANVQITRTGRVVLHDFGLARLVEQPAITSTDQVIGTPRYMAPELIRGERATAPADLYAVGMCLRFMLTGEPPYGGFQDIGALIERVLDKGLPPLAETCPDVPAELAAITDVLTAHRPEDRPRSAPAALGLLGPASTLDKENFSALVRTHPAGRRTPAHGVLNPSGGWQESGPPEAPPVPTQPSALPPSLLRLGFEHAGPLVRLAPTPGEPLVGPTTAAPMPGAAVPITAVPEQSGPMPGPMPGSASVSLPLAVAAVETTVRFAPERLRLGPETREKLLTVITPHNAASRLREAVSLVLRGDHEEAMPILDAIVSVSSTAADSSTGTSTGSSARLGETDPTALTSQFWQAVCLSRAGRGADALQLLAHVSHAAEERTHAPDVRD